MPFIGLALFLLLPLSLSRGTRALDDAAFFCLLASMMDAGGCSSFCRSIALFDRWLLTLSLTSESCWIRLDWIGLDWIGLDWIGLDCCSYLPRSFASFLSSRRMEGVLPRALGNGLLAHTPIVVDSFVRTSPPGLLYFLTHFHAGAIRCHSTRQVEPTVHVG